MNWKELILHKPSNFFNHYLDEFIREKISEAGGGTASFTQYTNYSALPDPTTLPGVIVVVLASQGTSWLPGSLGGTFYDKGFYFSNGASWSYLGDYPYQATQAEVDAESVTDKFVTPKTLGQWRVDKGLSSSGGVGPVTTLRISATAGTTINGGVCLMLDTDTKVYPFDPTNPYHYDKFVGVAETAALSNTSTSIICEGQSNYVGSGWFAGRAYYIDLTGFLTSTRPTTGFVKQVAVGINNDVVLVHALPGFLKT